jgi:hypothetical protein
MGTQDQFPDTQTTQETTPLPKGLFWRGHILWISRNVNGQRVQVSTGCKTIEDGLEAYRDFIEKHGLDKKPSPAQNGPQELPELPKGLYWKGNVIWLSRSVNGQHYNFSTGTSDPKLATQLLSDFNLRAFKGEKLGVYSRTPLTFRELAERYIEQGRLGGGLRPKSIARYQAIRDHFETFLQMRDLAERDAGTLGPAVVEDYKAWRFSTPVRRNGSPVTNGSPASKPGASPRTVQTEVQIVGSFFRYGVQIGLVDQNPVSRTRGIRVPEKAYTYLEEDEIKRLLDVAAAYDVWA